MTNRYQEFSQLNMPAIEQQVLAKWEEEQTFQKSVTEREGRPSFVFYEGPPSANGMPGIHHVISRTLKDLFCRYKTMQNFQVKRKAGWDTHGLPVELGVEKKLGITKEDIGKKISVADYNRTCREAVMEYKDKWDELTRRIGYWVDLSDPYITFDNNYIESLWWLLKQLYAKGLLYKSKSIQPYSPAAGTGLSSHELNMPGTYRDVKDTTCVAMFRLSDENPEHEKMSRQLHELASVSWLGSQYASEHNKDVFFMAWTTTPWTLPGNLGLTVGPNIDYVMVKTFNPYTHVAANVIMAQALLSKYFKPEAENADFEAYTEGDKLVPWKIIGTWKGSELEGLRYDQLLPFEGNSREVSGGDPFRVIVGDFVTTEDGTGIVHTAPAFGADDYRVGQKNNLGILITVDREGKFIDGLGEFSGRFVKDYKDEPNYVDVNVDICVKLKKENRAFKVEKYEHSYPHCWRTDKPVLYYPLDAWFIKVTAAKDRMVELNKTINWKPESTGTGRFGNWLENLVDWNLSRSRYWGTPLPVWRTADGAEEKCIGSIEELKTELEKAVAAGVMPAGTDINQLTSDLHKPYVDDIVLVSALGEPMRREPDLIDVWFDSGAMPYAQWHYPFENKENVENGNVFPADFIAEGVDQTRGWFYTLHAIAVMLFDSVAYKNVLSTGLVLDKNGNKMSKSKGNVIDPFDTVDKYSADATRWYLITNASPWDSLRFDLEGVKEIQRKFFGTLYNTYQFFTLYANVDKFTFSEAYVPVNERPEIDQWVLSSLHTLVKKVNEALDNYEPTIAGRLIEEFTDEHLSNWYVRLCRRRFWKGEYEHDKICAYQTLYECLETISKMIAPVSPFFADWLFNNLNGVTGRDQATSVHLSLFPQANTDVIDESLEDRMQLAQDASSLVLSLRKKVNIKVRQPLQKVLIPVLNPAMKEQLEKVEELIKTEVNVKEFQYISESEGVIHKKVKPNFKLLGARLGGKMKAVAALISAFTQDDIRKIEQDKVYTVTVDNEPVEVKLEEVDIIAEDIPGWAVASKGSLTLALDITISPELQAEGHARELVNRIQKIRKDSGLDLTDRINVKISETEELISAINQFNRYICLELLADRIEMVPGLESGTEVEVNDTNIKVLITKNS